MTHILGAVLVCIGCSWLGRKRAASLQERVWALEGLQAGLGQLERELTLRLTPLPELLGTLAPQVQEPAQALFYSCAAALNAPQPPPLAQIWDQACAVLPALTGEDIQILLPLGGVLGRWDAPSQGQAIAAVREALREQLRSAQADSRRLGRVYRAAGAAAGCFLAILLL